MLHLSQLGRYDSATSCIKWQRKYMKKQQSSRKGCSFAYKRHNLTDRMAQLSRKNE